MKLYELLSLREMAIEHLPEAIKINVKKRLESPIYNPSHDYVFYRALYVPLGGLRWSAANKAAGQLLKTVNYHPVVDTYERPEDESIIDNEPQDEELWNELVIKAAIELSNVAGFELPCWLTNEPKAQALQQEIETLSAEVERLQAENTALKAENEKLGRSDDTRQIKNMAKVIYGMAVSRYQYNPELQRNEATGVIVRAMQTQGIQTTASTIKRYIDTGKAALEEDGK